MHKPVYVPKTVLAGLRVLLHGEAWWTLHSLQNALWSYGIQASEAAISARVRDLRREAQREGGNIERRPVPLR